MIAEHEHLLPRGKNADGFRSGYPGGKEVSWARHVVGHKLTVYVAKVDHTEVGPRLTAPT
jgi:hypothetical protein